MIAPPSLPPTERPKTTEIAQPWSMHGEATAAPAATLFDRHVRIDVYFRERSTGQNQMHVAQEYAQKVLESPAGKEVVGIYFDGDEAGGTVHTILRNLTFDLQDHVSRVKVAFYKRDDVKLQFFTHAESDSDDAEEYGVQIHPS